MTNAMIVWWLWASGAFGGTVTIAPPVSSEQASQVRWLKMNDGQLRKLAVTSPAPVYPQASLAKNVTGVVVAVVRVTQGGVPEKVAILQSPDALTGRAVHETIIKWAFRPMAVRAEGLLVFYFHLQGARGVVLSPAEMRKVTNPQAKDVERADEAPVNVLTEPEFRALATRLRAVVLDIRDRETFAEGHETGAVNIPFGEILTRGLAELGALRHIVVDCRDAPDVCALVAHQLTSSGFEHVSILRR